MTTLLVVHILAGVALGLQFKVFALLPAFVASALAVGVGGTAAELGGWVTLGYAAAGFATLQLAYLGGLGLRALIATNRRGQPAVLPRLRRAP